MILYVLETRRRGLFLGVVVSTLVLLSGCAIQLVSSYDEKTDVAATALQRKFESFFVKLEGLKIPPACGHEVNKSFYDESKVDVSAIQVRVAAVPQNEITIEQTELLSKNLMALEHLHELKGKTRCLSPDEIKPLRQAFTSSLTAILKLELAKKRGQAK